MKRKLTAFIALLIMVIVIITSFSGVRSFLFRLYDLLVSERQGVIENLMITASGDWILYKGEIEAISFRKAGLVSQEGDVITVFSKKKLKSPCGVYGTNKVIKGYRVTICIWKNGNGEKVAEIYDLVDYPVFLNASNTRATADFLSKAQFEIIKNARD